MMRSGQLRRAVRFSAIRTARPGEPWISCRIESEERNTAIFSKRVSIQIQSADRDIAANKDDRLPARVSARHCNRTIQFQCFGQGMLRVIFFRRFAHQAGINDKQISRAIELKKLDRSADHVRETWLFAAGCDLIRVGQFALAKCAEEFWTSPARNGFQLGLRSHKIHSLSADFQNQIALVLAPPALGLWQEIARATAKHQIDSS